MKKPFKIMPRDQAHFKFFMERWDQIVDVVDYNQEWEKPISPKHRQRRAAELLPYTLSDIDKDVFLTSLRPGVVVKTMDDHGRKIILVGTRLGPVAVYPACVDASMTYLAVSYSRAILSAYIFYTFQRDYDPLYTIGGSKEAANEEEGEVVSFYNIGERIELMTKMLNDPSFRPEQTMYKKEPK